jgi:hypothetical protein
LRIASTEFHEKAHEVLANHAFNRTHRHAPSALPTLLTAGRLTCRSVHLPQRPYTLASKKEKEETHEFEDHNQKRN